MALAFEVSTGLAKEDFGGTIFRNEQLDREITSVDIWLLSCSVCYTKAMLDGYNLFCLPILEVVAEPLRII